MSVIVAIFCAFPIFLAGDFWLQRFSLSQSISTKVRWSLALALGAGFITLLHFAISILQYTYALTITVYTTLAVSALHLWQQRAAFHKWWQSLAQNFFLTRHWLKAVASTAVFFVVYTVSGQAGFGHDGYAFWGYKAKVIFLEGGWPPPTGQFASIPHADYPLLVSTLEAWVYWFLGEVDETAVKIVFVLFYAALVLLFYDTIRQHYGALLASIFTALMTLTPQLAAVSALSGYADVPLMLYIWGTIIFCYRWFKGGEPAYLFLAGTLAALAIWVKREGAVYYLVNGILIVAATSVPLIKDKKRSTGLLFFIPGLFIVVPWFFYLHWWQIPNSDFSAFTLNNIEIYINRLPVIFSLLGKQLFLTFERWGLLWWFFILTVFIKGVQRLQQTVHWYIFLLVLLPITILSVAFILSSWQPFTTHIAISLERLILHTVPIAWFFIALQATDLNQWLKSMVK